LLKSKDKCPEKWYSQALKKINKNGQKVSICKSTSGKCLFQKAFFLNEKIFEKKFFKNK